MSSRLHSTQDVADFIGCHPRTVTRTAKRHKVGELVGNALVFTAADLCKLTDTIRPGAPGNPKIGAQSANGVAARKRNLK